MKYSLFFFIFLFFTSTRIFAEGNPTITEPTILIPSPSLPSNINCLRSNNNVDVVHFNDRYYVAWRSARVHFPDKKAIMYIISSPDFKTWKYEHSFKTGADLREPRFLVYNHQLFFYCFEGAKVMYSFNPKHIWISTLANGKWADQIAPGMDGYVPWRFKIHHGKPLLSAYWGKNLYGAHQAQLRFFTSEDGISWKPISEKPQISITGSEEGEFEFDEAGNMWCIVRLEGEGAMLCYADKDSLENWHMFHTKKKYDSSCMFRHGKNIYLVARRNRAGNADKAPKWFPEGIKRTLNLTSYSFSPKTTALYKLNTEAKDFDWVMDLPGCGDNAFPAVVPIDNNNYYILNYTNDLSTPDITWFSGQFQNTYIYYLKLSFGINDQTE